MTSPVLRGPATLTRGFAATSPRLGRGERGNADAHNNLCQVWERSERGNADAHNNLCQVWERSERGNADAHNNLSQVWERSER